MNAPSILPSSVERILSPVERNSLAVTETCRAYAISYEGIEMQSEIVSQDREWGYVFRYDILNLVSNEDDVNPRFKEMNKKVLIVTKLILISNNGNKISRSITIPVLERSNMIL